MKRLVALSLLMTLLCSACIAESLPEIRFRDITFGTTIGQIEAATGKDIPTFSSDWYGSLDWLFETAGFMLKENRSVDAVLMESVREVKETAGYACSTRRFYVRPVKDGELDMDDDHAQLFIGQYQLYANSIEDAPDSVKDLTRMLSVLYGIPVVDETYDPNQKGKLISSKSTWFGDHDTVISLYWCDISNEMNLIYAWHGAQSLLEAAYECGVDEDNGNIFSGL
ncbi:MAG: hypothetical protein IJA77_00630 [Clostridia bacterium]|nr:hypothetical protein [Clostridia bacterium]